MITGSYRDQEFIRVGYFVDNDSPDILNTTPVGGISVGDDGEGGMESAMIGATAGMGDDEMEIEMDGGMVRLYELRIYILFLFSPSAMQ